MNIQINYDVIAVFLCIFLHKKIINNSKEIKKSLLL